LIRILGVREQHEWRGLQTPLPMQIQIPVMGPEQSVTSCRQSEETCLSRIYPYLLSCEIGFGSTTCKSRI
jgi:hypothetical protein